MCLALNLALNPFLGGQKVQVQVQVYVQEGEGIPPITLV